MGSGMGGEEIVTSLMRNFILIHSLLSIERVGIQAASFERIVILDICSFYTRGIWI